MKLFKKQKEKQLQTIEIGVAQTAILEIKSQILNGCATYDPIGLCTINDCFQCENCAYRMTFDNGVIVETDDFDKFSIESERYLLEFLTPIGKDIYGYLTDDNSDYRITRLSDNVVLRLTQEEHLAEYGSVSEVMPTKADQTNRQRLVLKRKADIKK